QPVEDVAQEIGLLDRAGRKQIELARRAIAAQAMRDAEVVVFRALAGELLAIGAPLQHGRTFRAHRVSGQATPCRAARRRDAIAPAAYAADSAAELVLSGIEIVR